MSENTLPKISASLVCYNGRALIGRCLASVLAQDYPNLAVVVIDNNSSDGSADYIRKNFPSVRLVEAGRNAGYSGGHNLGLRSTDSDFIWLLTQDLQVSPDYLRRVYERIILDDRIAGAQGKLLRFDPDDRSVYTIDSVGICLNNSRRPHALGQNEKDFGQYAQAAEVWGLDGAAPLYRRAALQDAAINGEVLDEDIFMYWDDIDISWRLRARGWKLWYEPAAVAWHGRSAGASPGGYRKVFSLIRHRRRRLSLFAKKMSFKNNLLVLIKNDMGAPFWRALPLILARLTAMLVYTILIEPKVLSVLPALFKQIPAALGKRRYVARHRRGWPQKTAGWV